MKLKPWAERHDLAVAVTITTACVGLAVGFLITASWSATGTITGGNSWNGGDLQHYFNATIRTSHGTTFTHVFSCDYYKVNSTVLVSYSWLNGYVIQAPIGCTP